MESTLQSDLSDMKDHDVIDAFIGYLRGHGFPILKVDRRPDKDNRDSADIDAIAGSFAIEHTSIDSVPNQRRNSDWFVRVAGGLEQELPTFPFRLNICLEYRAIAKGQDWTAIRQSLKNWTIEEGSWLFDGHHVLSDVAGVPFTLRVTKASDRPPGILFARSKPEDDTLPLRIREQLNRKAKKLARYSVHGKVTVLLVESDDIALMNEWEMLKSIGEAYGDDRGRLPSGVDQIWFADTSIPRNIAFRNLTPDLWTNASNHSPSR